MGSLRSFEAITDFSPVSGKKITDLKNLLCIFFLTFFPFSLSSQIKVDQGGDDWKGQTEKALEMIAKIDSSKVSIIYKNCDRISFWLGDYSSNYITPDGEKIILVSISDMKLGSVENLAGVLIHEAVHLWILNNNVHTDPLSEEILCYSVEMDFMKKIPNVESWITDHIQNQITYYKNKKLEK